MSEYFIVRTYSAGVFAGHIAKKSKDGVHIWMTDARRLWRWEGAASLSQLAATGTSKPHACKFPAAVNVELTGVIEILECTAEAEKSINNVQIWTC